MLLIVMLAKVGIKPCRFARGCVLHIYACIDEPTYPAEIVFVWSDTNNSNATVEWVANNFLAR